MTATPYLEGEFAFVMKTTLRPEDGPYTIEQLVAAIGELRPAIEVVGGRFTRFVGVPVPSIIADAGSNAHVVLGPPVATWHPADLPEQEATMSVDGQVATNGSGRDVLGNPVNSLHWLVEHLSERNIALEAGQVVATGTATKVTELPSGSTAEADFGPIGRVTTSY